MKSFKKHLLTEARKLDLQRFDIQYILEAYVPLEPKLISKYFGSVVISGLHVLESKDISKLRSIQGKNNSISMFPGLRLKNILPHMLGNASSNSIAKVTGNVIAKHDDDLYSSPGLLSKNNTRWVTYDKFERAFWVSDTLRSKFHTAHRIWIEYETEKMWKYITTNITDDEEESVMKMFYVDSKDKSLDDYFSQYQRKVTKIHELYFRFMRDGYDLHDDGIQSFVSNILMPLAKQLLKEYYIFIEKFFERKRDIIKKDVLEVQKFGEVVISNIKIDWVISFSETKVSDVYCPVYEFGKWLYSLGISNKRSIQELIRDFRAELVAAYINDSRSVPNFKHKLVSRLYDRHLNYGGMLKHKIVIREELENVIDDIEDFFKKNDIS